MPDKEYCDLDEIEALIGTAPGRIVISPDPPKPGTNNVNIRTKVVEDIKYKVESEMERRFARFYQVPLSLTVESTAQMVANIAMQLTGYKIWLTLHPQMTIDDLPASVTLWKTEADATMLAILPKGQTSPLAGRDILLEGELLLVDAGDPGEAIAGVGNAAPFGTRTE